MNVSPISFGRTVKVNAPLAVTKQAVELINNPQTKKGEAKVQQQLKTLFYDSDEGKAKAVCVNGQSYILTGKDSQSLKALENARECQLYAAKKNYGESPMYDLVKDSEDDRYTDLVKLLVAETEEPVELNLEYQKRKHRIKSINITI